MLHINVRCVRVHLTWLPNAPKRTKKSACTFLVIRVQLAVLL